MGWRCSLWARNAQRRGLASQPSIRSWTSSCVEEEMISVRTLAPARRSHRDLPEEVTTRRPATRPERRRVAVHLRCRAIVENRPSLHQDVSLKSLGSEHEASQECQFLCAPTWRSLERTGGSLSHHRSLYHQGAQTTSLRRGASREHQCPHPSKWRSPESKPRRGAACKIPTSVPPLRRSRKTHCPLRSQRSDCHHGACMMLTLLTSAPQQERLCATQRGRLGAHQQETRKWTRLRSGSDFCRGALRRVWPLRGHPARKKTARRPFRPRGRA